MATKSTVFCTSGKDLVKKATLEESRGFGPYDVRAGRANVFFQRRLSLSLSRLKSAANRHWHCT